MTKHLIIGGGPAAINAIETIREFDGGASQITLVSDEPAYSRMVLPYYLANQIPQQQVYTADDAYFETLKVQRLIGSRVSRVDPHAKTVTLQDGQNLPFDNSARRFRLERAANLVAAEPPEAEPQLCS